MTKDQDEWGHDPRVQGMRRIFSTMEAAQKAFWEILKISSLDTRLRRWREESQALFERAWPLASRMGIVVREEDTASLYLHCLARVLHSNGVEIPIEVFPRDEKILRFLNERLP